MSNGQKKKYQTKNWLNEKLHKKTSRTNIIATDFVRVQLAYMESNPIVPSIH